MSTDDQHLCANGGCGRERKSKGLCATHYKAHRRRVGEVRVSTRTCDADGCGRDHYAHGLCKRCYGAKYRPKPAATTCSADGCSRQSYGSKYCGSHRLRAATGRMDVPVRAVNQTGCLFDCDGKHFRIGVCRRHYRGGRVDTYRSKAGGDFRGAQLLWKYRISLEEREALFADQDGLCAICVDYEATDIDHDHAHECADSSRAASRKRGCRDCVRGGLCNRCNVTLAAYEGEEAASAAARDLLNDPLWKAMADIHLKQRPFAGTPDPIKGAA